MTGTRAMFLVGLIFVVLGGSQARAATPATTQAVQGTAHETLVAFATTWRDLRDDAAMQLMAVRSPDEQKLVASFGRQIRAERMLRDAVIKRWGAAQRRFLRSRTCHRSRGTVHNCSRNWTRNKWRCRRNVPRSHR